MLQRVASNTDICVRSGGDEFCVLLLDTKLAGAQEFEQWLLAALETKLDLP
ncbi:GGDEF domain-containing protein [Azohydromonas lata]|nr:GGDEF domain-containing protein [Azohydromonas lata]